MQYPFNVEFMSNLGVRRTALVYASSRREIESDAAKKGLSTVSASIDWTRFSKELFSRSEKLSVKEAAEFFRQVHSYMISGNNVKRIFTLFSERKHGKEGRVSRIVLEKLNEGRSLTEAFAETKAFDPIVQGAVTAGSLSGNLDKAFEFLAEEFSKTNEAKSKLKTAMIYPSIMLVVAFISVKVLVDFTLPSFQDLGGAPSGMTAVMTDALRFFSHNWLYFLAAFIAFIYSLVWSYKNTKYRKTFFKIPLLGKILRYSIYQNLFSLFTILTSSGMSLGDTMKVVEGDSNANFEKKVMAESISLFNKGLSIEECFRNSFFPDFVRDCLLIAGETGIAETQTDALAKHYGKELSSIVGRMEKLMMPIILLLFALVFVSIAAIFIEQFFETLKSVKTRR